MKKEPTAVSCARSVLLAAEKSVEKAKSDLDAANQSYGAAYKALSQALIDADNGKPRCVIATAGIGGRIDSSSEAVIDRKTPAGMIVARRVGQEASYASMFKFCKRRGEYMLWRRAGRYYTTFLQDVPPEFMPKDAT